MDYRDNRPARHQGGSLLHADRGSRFDAYLHAQSIAIESGQVFIPEKADWFEELRTELLQFPRGRFDDQVDSITHFLKVGAAAAVNGNPACKLSGI